MSVENELLITNTETKFSDFQIPEFLVSSLEKGGITNPSPVQEKAIPLALEGRDILASAQTGTGKTIAFLLPIITRMLESPESNALILAPTRELAVQVREAAFKLLPRESTIKSISLIGGDSIMRQITQLKGLEEGAVMPKKPQGRGFMRRGNPPMPTGGNGIHKNVIFVGTPGRVKDLIDRGAIKLEKAHFLVLDETDRMLDLGFKEALEEIFTFLPKQRQTLMFSATMPGKIISLSREFLTNPARVDIEKRTENQPKINQEIIKYSYSQKFSKLAKLLTEKEGTAIIFTKTKMGTEDLAAKLQAEGIEAMPIHGDLKQREREFVIKSLKADKIRLMVATDVAARGLHINNIQMVINYDLPGTKEDYIHRIGRTGRAGAEGNAISFVNEDDFREAKVAKAYMRTEDDEDNEDVKSFSRDYTSRRKPSGGRSGGGSGGFRGRSNYSGGGFSGNSGGNFNSGGGERRSYADRPKFNDDRPRRESTDRREGGERRESTDRREGGERRERKEYTEERRDGGKKGGFFSKFKRDN
jgi:superfamily II DNA/RNA helicase